MIPVLGVPILTEPHILAEMIGSIDHPIGRLYIIDNGNVVDESLLPGDVYKPGYNLGVAASWNQIIRDNPAAPWWMIVNHDIMFRAGDLARIDEHMEANGGLALLSTMSAFGLDRATVAAAGLFDENLHPAYFEDNDYYYRCQLKGVPIAGLPFGGSHRNSSTILGTPSFRLQNMRTFPHNQEYYCKKWGGQPGREVFTTPFNAGGDPSEWTLDEARLKRQRWVIE